MREIKFRAWDKEHKAIKYFNDIVAWHGPSNWKDFYELMQFTGLIDKNEREIYEGDIVHYKYLPGPGQWNADCDAVISWKSTGFHMLAIRGHGGFNAWLISWPGAFAENNPNELFEVIGNIYENPDLLEKP